MTNALSGIALKSIKDQTKAIIYKYHITIAYYNHQYKL